MRNDDHDVYSCDCHETCSICAEPHWLRNLKRHTFTVGSASDTWEFVCPSCREIA